MVPPSQTFSILTLTKSVIYYSSANPASQFRFQSEKDWDQETDASTTQVSIKNIFY